MATIEEFHRIAKFNEAEVRRWMDREWRRHGPNFAGQVWDWICVHHKLYLTVWIAAVLYGLFTSSQPDLGRAVHGIVWGMLVLIPAAAAFLFAKEPWWYEPKAMPRRFRDSPTLRDLLLDPAYELREQILKLKGEPDAYDLAHVLWLVRKDPFGKDERRGLMLSSSLEKAPIVAPTDRAFSTE